jgi:hypothetical protein
MNSGQKNNLVLFLKRKINVRGQFRDIYLAEL